MFFFLCLDASIEVRQAAAQCVKNILATQSGVQFWEQHKNSRDPMLAYLHPFRKAKKQVCVRDLFLCDWQFLPVSFGTGCRARSGRGCERGGEFGGPGEAGEFGVLDSSGGPPQGLAEGSVHRPAGQRRGEERGFASVPTVVSGERLQVASAILVLPPKQLEASFCTFNTIEFNVL